MAKLSPFHLAIPVLDLNESKNFYEKILDCSPGRFSEESADYNFFGHQLVIHLDPNHKNNLHNNEVDGKSVPIPHFGVVVPWDEFDKFSKKLEGNGVKFIIEPYTRFKNLPGEQKTLFFCDNSGNVLEFKSFKNMEMLFSTEL
jgi:extradiol dioxygenase family protein